MTDSVRTERGPVLNSCCSLASSSSGVISDLGFVRADDDAISRTVWDSRERRKTLGSDFVRAARSSENVFGFFGREEKKTGK